MTDHTQGAVIARISIAIADEPGADSAAESAVKALRPSDQLPGELVVVPKGFFNPDGAGAKGLRQQASDWEIGRLRDALTDATAHLIGATSAYKTFAKRHISQGKPETDALFRTRAQDFDRACERARAALNDESWADIFPQARKVQTNEEE